MSKTIMKSATVKVMLSHNYNHFEASICLENEEGLTVTEINEARKDCNRLCDTAIRQYNDANRDDVSNSLTPHRCPVCNGNGLVPNGFYGHRSTTSIDPETCRSCNGTGIVWC